MLLVLNLPLIGLWVQILKIPYPILFPLIIVFCLIGAFSLNTNPAEIMIIFGVLGYLMKKFRYDGASFVLAVVLGLMIDNSLRQSLLMSGGNPTIFITRPICLAVFAIVAAIFLLPLLPRIGRVRKTVADAENAG